MSRSGVVNRWTPGQWLVLLVAVGLECYFLFVDKGPGAAVWALATLAVGAFLFQGLGERRRR